MKLILSISFTLLSFACFSQNKGDGVVEVRRSTIDTPSYLNGAKILFSSQASNGTIYTSNQFLSRWSTPTFGSRVSEFTIAGVNNATTQNLFQLSGNGQAIFNQYTGTNFNTAQAKVAMIGTDGKMYGVDTTGLFSGGGGGSLPSLAQYHLYVGNASNLPVDGGTGMLYNGTSLLLNGASTSYNNILTVKDQTQSQARFYGWTPTGGSSAGALVGNNTISNGAIALGDHIDYQGVIGYLSTGNTKLIIGNTWNSASAEIDFMLRMYSASSTTTAMKLFGSGAMQLPAYVSGTIPTGTAAYSLSVDASGNVIGTVSGITADNGLTASTSTNVQLGGTLTGNTTITGGGNFMIFTGTSSATVTVNNTSTGGALSVQSGAGTGIGVSSTTGDAFTALNTATTGVANMTSNPSSTNTDVSVLTLTRNTSGTAANNIAGSLRFNLQTSTTGGTEANRIISKWTDVTHATRTSQFIITGVNSATTADLFTLNGNGNTQLNKYGVGTFSGTTAYNVSVDASGNLIETSNLNLNYYATAVDYTVEANRYVVNVTATGKTITLPTAVGIAGRIITVKLTASGSGTIATTSSQTIDGSTTYSLSAQYKFASVMSDGANWIIIANN